MSERDRKQIVAEVYVVPVLVVSAFPFLYAGASVVMDLVLTVYVSSPETSSKTYTKNTS